MKNQYHYNSKIGLYIIICHIKRRYDYMVNNSVKITTIWDMM